MLDIKIYSVMGECIIDVLLTEGAGTNVMRTRWQGSLDGKAPLSDLVSHITSALEAADKYAGDVHAELLFGSSTG